MDSPLSACLDTESFLAQLGASVSRARVPFSGSMDLTDRCNLRCVHCYVAAWRRGTSVASGELATGRVLSILDEVTQAGCLFMLMTGGEPLLRPDFARIYTYARENGLFVTVFTNGTLADDNVAALFADLPPRAVEISLYGATAATYERVTGVGGSFDKCVAGIERLLARGVRLKLKFILMTLNRHEFHDMERMAGNWGLTYRIDAAIFPRFDGDKSPLGLRVPAEEAVALEMADVGRLGEWRDYHHRVGVPPPGEALYCCSAGRTMFHVDAGGRLQPCMMTPHIGYDLAAGTFAEGWARIMADMDARTSAPDHPCNACRARALCGHCPGFSLLETGDETARSEYLCRLGRLRLDRVAAGAGPVEAATS